MDFLSGFAWPVPRAFASATAVCRFEQGDVFFDTLDGYAAWKARRPRFHVQVLDPPRTARSVPAESEGRFAANWSSLVTCAVRDRKASTTEVVTSTQGRLFTCLWRGDLSLLSAAPAGASEALPLPCVARDLQKHLAFALPALRQEPGPPSAGGLWFVSVVDESSEASLAKARDVESVLSARYAVTIRSLSPQEAGVPDGQDYHPALRIRGVGVEETNEDVVRGLLKQALYGPTRSGTDRFKVERHGLLVGPAGAASD